LISLAVDIGGTFVDVVAADASSGTYYAVKVPTTPGNLVDGVREGTVRALALAGWEPKDVARFVHGTTVATNAVLERKGATTAVLATEGFEDILEIGRLRRSEMYDPFIGPETPVFLAPKRFRRGIRERVGSNGEVVKALDEDQVREVISELLDEQGIEAFAVSLLFSFRNSRHEQRVRELIAEIDPEVGVSLSSEVDPTFREYERTVVTAFDAYVRPVIERYVSDLSAELQKNGIAAPLQIMQSRGGITSGTMVREKPVSVLLSGPAAGVIGGKLAAAQSGFANVITIDVGGTSADISLVAEGKHLISRDSRIDRYPLRIPMVDVTAIGAGGGSIAWVDGAGGFNVGPQSAGAEPGPACYQRGGVEATVTDASVVLGYLNPTYFAGGTLDLDPAAAEAAVALLGERLGLSVTETAAGIHRVINANMADAIRLVSIQRGYDPRDFALVAFGGGGPVHAGVLAAKLSIPSVIVPPVPGVLSALGLQFANVEHDRAETVAVQIDDADPSEIEATYRRLDARVSDMMKKERAPASGVTSIRLADMRYVGQAYSLEVEVANEMDAATLRECVARFHEAHERVYGHARASAPVEVVNLRVVQSWQNTDGKQLRQHDDPITAGPNARQAYFEELGGYAETPVYRRASLPIGARIAGPAIIEQMDTTVVVYPGFRARIDESTNLILHTSESARDTA
jgi:N-methylhydantoinase A